MKSLSEDEKHPPFFKKGVRKLDLSTGWLSGFLDAEGCFSGSSYIDKNEKFYTRLRFTLVQKGEEWLFSRLKDIFGGSVWLAGKKQEYVRYQLGKKHIQPLLN